MYFVYSELRQVVIQCKEHPNLTYEANCSLLYLRLTGYLCMTQSMPVDRDWFRVWGLLLHLLGSLLATPHSLYEATLICLAHFTPWNC